MNGFLDHVPLIDWSDIDRVSKVTQLLLRKLAADKDYLRALIDSVKDDNALLAKCEMHELDDKIVIYDALETRRFRIRLRLATAYQDERPHTHRFPFSTLILRGNYEQTMYYSAVPLADNIDMAQVQPIYLRTEPPGTAFTIQDSVIHSTIAPPDTISLLIRGPATKSRAIIMHPDRGTISWRYGERDESAARRCEVAMPMKVLLNWRARLAAYQVI